MDLLNDWPPALVRWSAATSSAVDSLELRKIIPVSGDGQCFFRSLAVAMNVTLQAACQSEHGVILNRRLHETECKEADELRAKVVKYMREHLSQFPGEHALLNADMPAHIHYSSFVERIQAMSEAKTMPGEYEIIATSKALERVIATEDISGTEINRYGCVYSDKGTPLVVRYISTGQRYWSLRLHPKSE